LLEFHLDSSLNNNLRGTKKGFCENIEEVKNEKNTCSILVVCGFLLLMGGCPLDLGAGSNPDATPLLEPGAFTMNNGVIDIANIVLPQFIPPQPWGRDYTADADFDGNGPKVSIDVSIRIKPGTGELWADVSMSAKETAPDWTEAKGATTFFILRHDRPLTIAAPQARTYHFEYTDTNHDDDMDKGDAAGPVKKLVIVGDTRGYEAGTKTGVTVFLNKITLEEIGTPPTTPPACTINLSVDQSQSTARPVFNWNKCPDCISYWLHVVKNSPNASNPAVVDVGGLTGDSYQPTTDLQPGTYYARLKGVTGGTNGRWTGFQEFTVESTTTPCSLDLAVDSGVSDIRPVFSWNQCPSYAKYWLYVVKGSPDASSPCVIDARDLAGSSYQPNKDLDGGTYYAKLKGVTGYGTEGEWTGYKEFVVYPRYTLSVMYTCFTGDGTMYEYTETSTNFRADSVFNLSAPEVVSPGSPIPDLHFQSWSISGTASIDDVSAASTMIRNFGSDVSVKTIYY